MGDAKAGALRCLILKISNSKEKVMNDSQYKYLDEERIKLWGELRQLQAHVETILTVASADASDEQKTLTQIGIKAAHAFRRIKERDDTTEKLTSNIKSAQAILSEADSLLAELKATRERISNSAQEVVDARNKFDEEISGLESRANSLSEREQKLEEVVSESETTRDEMQSLLDDIEGKHTDSNAKYQDISKVHKLLWGYTKENGEVVEGKKQELESTYEELEQKINATKAGADSFEKEYQEKCNSFLESAKSEAEALANRVRGLLPDAMTAGLSSAYLENRKTEEAEQQKQMGLFTKCIWGMMLLALLPIGLNLGLWYKYDKSLLDILAMLPRQIMCILPLYVPLFWLAIFANKRVNLSKRLIEEYKHKEAVSKTYEGLSRQISEIADEDASQELQKRLLFNTIMLSEKNPGELIKNFNRPDNPLFDMLNQGSRFADAMNKLASVPGIEQLIAMVGTTKQKAACDDDRKDEDARERT